VAFLDRPTSAQIAQGITHRIGSEFNAPQATLMATLIKGLLSFNLDWQFVLVGVVHIHSSELCGVKSLSFCRRIISAFVNHASEFSLAVPSKDSLIL
jgi:hypothetical protein